MITVALELLIVVALVAILLLGRNLLRQLESLRAEIAAARIAGVLDHNEPVP
ncbi:hypothetical protein ACFRH6_17120 [Streptomyces sp. NPDC056749]|uniref:hypothetical protein n=1 Tax=Streptomyces sp. NPDC056749 TaxID=3345936 RepID=UPI0036991835